MAGYESIRVDVDGVETGVRLAGEGEPLVFFHGGGIVEGADCLLPLAEQFRLIVPFHPGFGETASAPRVSGLDDWIAHYARLLDMLGVGELVLIGHSLGGWLAARFVLAHPDRVRRLVLAPPFGLEG